MGSIEVARPILETTCPARGRDGTVPIKGSDALIEWRGTEARGDHDDRIAKAMVGTKGALRHDLAGFASGRFAPVR